ncbi:hypothetical protein HMPREF3145_01735 [Corynebacterium sp. HMSC05C01]|uniref:hypothetical protein n=1 Tax=unclassified Corynebacterium TaxID=2624378 RepID=UPI0008A429D6|nr:MULTISPECIES: hypothetical protein [unclassified Corynebacterium]OFT72054.1 hypothetical protein HMPREF3145_01735 [Corynebacterium sp. HMSC05C01]OHO78054.1 hypothetical protein HMPREF2736_11080 [Corynebacterium sp. HMSC036E10]
MTTIETALSMATLVVVTAAIVGGIATMSAYIAAVDIAGAAARAHAMGVDYTAPRGEVSMHESAGLATVTAAVPAPIGTMRATAVFPVEF